MQHTDLHRPEIATRTPFLSALGRYPPLCSRAGSHARDFGLRYPAAWERSTEPSARAQAEGCLCLLDLRYRLMAENVEELFTRFEEHLARLALAPTTIVNYLADLRTFARWHANVNGAADSLLELTPDDIREYRHPADQRGVDPCHHQSATAGCSQILQLCDGNWPDGEQSRIRGAVDSDS